MNINYVNNAKGTSHVQNMDFDRKFVVIKENIHKFSYDEICNFFEKGESENEKIIQDLEEIIEQYEEELDGIPQNIIEVNSMVDEMKVDALKENWERFTLEQLYEFFKTLKS